MSQEDNIEPIHQPPFFHESTVAFQSQSRCFPYSSPAPSPFHSPNPQAYGGFAPGYSDQFPGHVYHIAGIQGWGGAPGYSDQFPGHDYHIADIQTYGEMIFGSAPGYSDHFRESGRRGFRGENVDNVLFGSSAGIATEDPEEIPTTINVGSAAGFSPHGNDLFGSSAGIATEDPEEIPTTINVGSAARFSPQAPGPGFSGQFRGSPVGNNNPADIPNWNIPTISNMEEKFESLEKAFNETPTQSPSPLIQRVPYVLRNHKNFKKYFEPRVMAIGPLHHPLHHPFCLRSHLLPAEQHKRRLAFLFVKDSRQNTDVLYKNIWTEIPGLRKCFDEEEIKSFTDEELCWILFVDGCAVLQLIKCIMNEKWDELNIKPNLTVIMTRDLFLLENQIPFQVLKLLLRSSETQWHWRDVVQKLVERNKVIKSKKEEKDIVNPVHLLDLLRTYLVANTSPNSKNSPPLSNTESLSLPLSNSKNPPKKRAENCWNIFRNVLKKDKDYGWHTFRNVKDLKSAGIFPRPSSTNLLTDISFTSWWFAGKLTLPVIRVDGFTRPKFMNLIAYEMCPDYNNDFTVISYICFMDSLIDQAEDVQELRKARILINYLGSDDEAAQLFNEISTDLVMNPNVYRSVKKKIEKHYEKKWNTWLAEAYHDHFSSPWTILVFTGAVIALVLTAVQTWFTVSSNW